MSTDVISNARSPVPEPRRDAARWYGVALVLTALSMTAEAAHVLELPQKLRYDAALYATVNGTLYLYFAIVGGSVQVGAIIVTALLAARARGRAARPALAAAALLALALAAWAAIVAPVNAEVSRVARERPAALPSLWAARRIRWEGGHVVGFVLQLAGYAALVAAALRHQGQSRGGPAATAVELAPDAKWRRWDAP
jgi:hypothetical protein